MDIEMNLCWHDEVPDDTDVIEKVTRELQDLIDGGLERPSDLILHTVFLTDDIDGPSVAVWGEEGSTDFHCRLNATTEWISLGTDDDETRH